MRKLSVATIFIGMTLACAVQAQDRPGGIVFSPYRQFRIPFSAGPTDQSIKQLQLYASLDQGKTWQPSATAPPEQRQFNFTADRDAYYWFAVQVTNQQGQIFPVAMEGAQPSLKVIVDTQPPAISLQSLPARGNEVGVAWDIRDENLDLAVPDSLRLEYRLSGGFNWIPLTLSPGTNQHYWNPQFNGPVEVRLKARDRAGNHTTQAANLGPQGNNFGGGFQGNNGLQQPESPGLPNPAGFQGPTEAERQFINSKKITLDYQFKEVGPSGVSVVELWYTVDGRAWNKYPVNFGEDPNKKNITFDVVGEGIYGLTMVAKSGVGLGMRPPQLGDRPQIWMEVDLTKPLVQLRDVIVHTGAEKGKLTIDWNASDRNLHKEPITLSYAEKETGPWTKIVEKLPNNGRYTWSMPEKVPYQFHVKVEAADKASNVGEDLTRALVKVDLSNPKVQILKVAPAGN